MENDHGGKRLNSGRKPKKLPPTLEAAFDQAVPVATWVSIWSNLATLAKQTEDPRVAILAARELRQYYAAALRSAPPPPPAPEPVHDYSKDPPLFIYEHNNDGPLPDYDGSSATPSGTIAQLSPTSAPSTPAPRTQPAAKPQLEKNQDIKFSTRKPKFPILISPHNVPLLIPPATLKNRRISAVANPLRC